MKEESKEIKIKIPNTMYDLLEKMAEISSDTLKTSYTVEEMVSKLVTQYFGTRQSIDIMMLTINKIPDLFQEEKAEINTFNDDFNAAIIQLDHIAQEVSKKFISIIEKLKEIDE